MTSSIFMTTTSKNLESVDYIGHWHSSKPYMQLDAQTKQIFKDFDDYTILCYCPRDLNMPLIGSVLREIGTY